MADWPSDKELEEIYRRGSEGHDFEYNEDAWKDMERLLDRSRKRRFFFFMFSVLALGSLTYLMSPLFTSDVYKNQKLTEVNLESDAINLDIASLSSSASQKTLDTKEITSNNTHSSSVKANESLKKQVDQAPLITSENSKAKASTRIQKNPITFVNKRVGSYDLNRTENKTPAKFNLEFGISNISGSNYNESGDITNTQINIASSETIQNNNTIENLANSETRIDKNKLSLDLGSLYKIPVMAFPVSLNWNIGTPELATLTQSKKVSYSTLLIGATIGAESSWSPQGEFSSIDLNIGLRGSYYIGNKIGINIGASYINDIFEAPGMDYNPKQEFWKASGAPGSPMMAHAESSMIELSTGITYAFNSIDNNGISLGANLISNFMLKESYEYLYPNENNNFNSSWTMANSTWLNALDLTASYRIRLSDNWLLESGPYFKVPIEGIGHGNIKLTSFGIRFSLGFSK